LNIYSIIVLGTTSAGRRIVEHTCGKYVGLYKIRLAMQGMSWGILWNRWDFRWESSFFCA